VNRLPVISGREFVRAMAKLEPGALIQTAGPFSHEKLLLARR
jgi:hypothetical protein